MLKVADAVATRQMSSLCKKLALATCTLITQSALAADGDWVADTSYLSYTESDDRVSVNKTLANLTRSLNDGSLSINIIHDTMSGASPTGAIRGNDASVTFTGASGGSGFSTSSGGDYSLSQFEDTRFQLGADREQEINRRYTLSYGGVISSEDDYESMGTSVGVKRESVDKLYSVNTGFAFTTDTIYRSNSNDTPVALNNVNSTQSLGKGKRNTYDALLGYTRIINRHTVAQVNTTFGLSDGYHSDPYKIISAADDSDRITDNFHDSRPVTRQRNTLFGKMVHQLRNTKNSMHVSYRYYQDSWGIVSHTMDLRYHRALTDRQYLEPHLRLYRQSAANFYYRKLNVDDELDPIMPADGFASADYRLDQMTSYTVGIKYGFAMTPKTDLRLRAEYIGMSFAESEYESNNAIVLQASLKYTF